MSCIRRNAAYCCLTIHPSDKKHDMNIHGRHASEDTWFNCEMPKGTQFLKTDIRPSLEVTSYWKEILRFLFIQLCRYWSVAVFRIGSSIHQSINSRAAW